MGSEASGCCASHWATRSARSPRKLIETWFGDGKQYGGTIRQVKLRGLPKVTGVFTLAMLTVNLRRLPKLFSRQAGLAGTG